MIINPYIFGSPSSYLLDTYGSAGVAHSLRKLSSSYLGQCVRVRRSSDNAEQDISFNNGIIDTTSLLSFVGAGDGFVTTWHDQSGNGLNAIQSTATSQPLIVSSGTLVTVNGLPSIKSITSDSLAEARTLSVNSSYSIIFKADVVTNGNVLFGGGTIRQRFLLGTTGYFAIDAGTDLNSNTLSDTNQRSAMLYFDASTSSQIWLNGILDKTGNAGSNATSPHSIFGASDINIQEFIVWGSNYTSNALAIHNEQQTYYGF
jgi:hypothetical protein